MVSKKESPSRGRDGVSIYRNSVIEECKKALLSQFYSSGFGQFDTYTMEETLNGLKT